MSDIYSLYKPLRNYLRPFSLWQGLGAIYCYLRFLDGEGDLPEKLATPLLKGGGDPMRAGLHPWLLDLLSREMILNGQMRGGESFNTAGPVFKALDMILKLEDGIWGLHEGDEDDVLLEMLRIAHRQFPWQQLFSQADVTRYFKLYSHPEFAGMIEAEFGLSAVEYFQFLFLLLGEVHKSPVVQPARIGLLSGTVGEPVRAILGRINRTAVEMRESARELQSYDINWAYTLNPLREHPLIHAGNFESLMCPIPAFLANRLTDGLYFDLIRSDQSQFANAAGAAFEAYIGSVFHEGLPNCISLPERTFGRQEKRSVDWIVEDGAGTLFVECKFGRLNLAAKTEISDRKPFDGALRRLAGHIAQLYATLRDAIDGQYPHWRHAGQPIFPMVVTLSNWFTFGFYILGELAKHVETAFAQRGLDRNLLDEYPYTICSVEELEYAVRAMAASGLTPFMAEKTGAQYRDNMLKSFLLDRYREIVQTAPALFDDAFDGITRTRTRMTDFKR